MGEDDKVKFHYRIKFWWICRHLRLGCRIFVEKLIDNLAEHRVSVTKHTKVSKRRRGIKKLLQIRSIQAFNNVIYVILTTKYKIWRRTDTRIDAFTTLLRIFSLCVLNLNAISSSTHGTIRGRREFWCFVNATSAHNASRSAAHELSRNTGKLHGIYLSRPVLVSQFYTLFLCLNTFMSYFFFLSTRCDTKSNILKHFRIVRKRVFIETTKVKQNCGWTHNVKVVRKMHCHVDDFFLYYPHQWMSRIIFVLIGLRVFRKKNFWRSCTAACGLNENSQISKLAFSAQMIQKSPKSTQMCKH